MSRNPREGEGSGPQPQRPPDTNYFAVLKLSLFMRHRLKAAGLEEVLKGFEPKGYLEELDPNYRFFIFRTNWCVEAEGERFAVYCRPIREDLEGLAREAPPVEGPKLKVWVEKLRELDRELSEVDKEIAKLLGLESLEGPKIPEARGAMSLQ